MRNPAFPAGHWYEFSGGKTPTVGHWRDMRIESQALVGKAWFKPRGLGEEVWLDYLDGNLTSVSVAFLTREWEMRQIGSGADQRRVRVFTKVDLIECSAVLIPANPQARLRAASYAPPLAPAASNEGALKGISDRLERLEYLLSDDPDDPQFNRSNGIAERQNGREGLRDLGYFSDAPDGDTPAPRSDDQGNDHDIKAALRELTGAAGD